MAGKEREKTRRSLDMPKKGDRAAAALIHRAERSGKPPRRVVFVAFQNHSLSLFPPDFFNFYYSFFNSVQITLENAIILGYSIEDLEVTCRYSVKRTRVLPLKSIYVTK
ncbi:hypothetical protein CDAR_412051 [Caerostris darwini]|uniref:Uncharacterized protein n=1 Tax=Caerostris darwini TaxID=1538125 RepID=A0AAV4WDG2_9ARAC|nr:hypothetical protein CDAR_412051 [Caerostris darwini]